MYANTCWGLLCLAVTFGLAVVGLPPQYEWLQPWFLDTAVACGVSSIVCFGWPLREKENRVRLRELCVHPYRVAKLIEPLHVIILGLVIALGGVVWQMRAAKTSAAETARAKSAPIASAATVSDFGWGFERYPGYDFVGMGMGGDGQILVHQFQAQGHNETKDPMVKVTGVVRSDRTSREFPILFNLGDGKYLTSDQINPIPVDAIIDTRAYFSNDEKPIPLKQFLSDFVPFTFIFNYDGKTYRHRFTLEDVEPRIQRYEQDMRKMSVKPPQMSAKPSLKPQTQVAHDGPSVTTPGIGSPPSLNQTRMKWNEIFGTTRAVDRVFALFLDGHGPASKSMKLKRAYLESAKTGEVIEMKVAGETLVDDVFHISEANPIPPNGFIRLIAKMNPSDSPTGTQNGLTNREFLERWGSIWFNATYEEGDPDRILFEMAGYFPEIAGPHATRRSEAEKE